MKIKLAYPKIPDTLHCPLKQCIAFEKIDGTLINFVWSPLEGFHSFGTRRDRFPYRDGGFSQFHQAHPGLSGLKQATEELLESYPMGFYLQTTAPYAQAKEVILFAEFAGPNSFAGSHSIKDDAEDKHCTLFDVQVDGVMLPPGQFLTDFQGCRLPKVVFQGKFTGQLFIDVRKGKYDVKEGVVVKGMVDGQVYMAKIKTNDYLRRLKEEFKDNWKEYWE